MYNRYNKRIDITTPICTIHVDAGGVWQSCEVDHFNSPRFQFKRTKWPSGWFMDVRVDGLKACLIRSPFCQPTGDPYDVYLKNIHWSPPDQLNFEMLFEKPFLRFSPKSKQARLSATPSKLPIYNDYLWFSFEEDWELCQVGEGVYHLRYQLWEGSHFWKVDVSQKKVFSVTEGTFGQPGTRGAIRKDVSVEPVY